MNRPSPLGEDAVRELLAESGFPSYVRVGAPFEGGRNSVVYPVESGRMELCLKVYSGHKPGALTREAGTLLALERASIDFVPRLVQVFSAPDAILITRVPGDFVPGNAWDDAMVDRFANAMLRIHETDVSSGTVPDRLWNGPRMLERVNEMIHRTGDAELCSAWERVHHSISLAVQPDSTRHTCLGRGDPSLRNVLWSGSDLHVIDFENSGVSDVSYELADLLEHPTSNSLPVALQRRLVSTILPASEEWRLARLRLLFQLFWAIRTRPGAVESVLASAAATIND